MHLTPAHPLLNALLTGLLFLSVSSGRYATAADEATSASQDANAAGAQDDKTPEGHSYHGEVFNEGPRQAAWLMEGVGKVRFPVTSSHADAIRFVEQGVAQLHGFWYFESERSFRQAATLDPDCAIAYWGMAMSNRSNADRAKNFIKEAVARKDKASRREQLYIAAFDRYINAKAENADEKEKRAERYMSDLDDLLIEFPDDIEAKAFLCEFFWSARRENVNAPSYLAVDAMIEDVLEVEPMHPAHHYRIHLWDTKKPENAVRSAALCGPSAPAIAHMWHMPGHIYSRLKRYHDAVWQQEASARVDHAHMMHDRVMPDQIHNFAHNNEWCIRNMISIGRVHDAVALARNMISMPRHPTYNHLDKFGSFKYGRQRLMQVLRTFELHDQILRLSETDWLGPVGDKSMDLERRRAVGAALAAVGQADAAGKIRSELDGELQKKRDEQKTAGDEAVAKATEEKKDEKGIEAARKSAEDKFGGDIRNLEQAVQEIDGRLAALNGDFATAIDLVKKAGDVSVEYQTALLVHAEQFDDAVKRIESHVKSNQHEVLPLASQVVTLWKAGKRDEARAALDELRKLSQVIDLDVPAFAAVTPIAVELGFESDWRQPLEVRDDLMPRPDLDALGPFRWQPVQAPAWQLAGVGQEQVALHDFRGRPVVLVFYLGYGCLHCAEQLQAFDPMVGQFRDAGIDVIAVSTDKQEDLARAWKDLDAPLKMPLLSDNELQVFRSYRCYDDFEQQPLHGTFVIDQQGRIRWQDISYEPFMDPAFVLQEAKRLLSLDVAETETTELHAAQVDRN